ncbi:MAG: NupC/NupG family nucleoside CNT transporter [Deltaproteobacteria bacterium]|nr:NupC/NupG family nucleoside CNT transporter [Deltaproteobacteria bacterium]
MSEPALRAVSALGFVTMIAIAWLCSSNRSRIRWDTVAWGVALQLALGLLLLRTGVGRGFFVAVNTLVNRFLAYTEVGTRFVFGPLMDTGFSIAIHVLPVIVFMGSFFSILYHLGVIQRVVGVMAWVLERTMKLSGAEALAAVANIFVGMVESSLVVKPYLARMTHSELFSLMTLGMGTVAGSVLLAYVGILGGGDFAGHLVTASLLSAPAGLLLAKIMIPETEESETAGGAHAAVELDSVNVIDAAASGAINGLRLAAYVGAMLVAFVALVAMLNDGLGYAGSLVGIAELSFQKLLGFLLAPLAFLMGIPWEDAPTVGGMLGIKTILNEFLAYQELSAAQAAGTLQPRSVVIASYALCGFANFGSLAIMLGGIGGLAPQRHSEVAGLGLRCILSGSLTTFMTACLAGLLL